ncbi:Serine/threonine-protein kinase [Venturia inaequalis]|nr:Serine/threonine-protein kinase [Venturia inaequalis]
MILADAEQHPFNVTASTTGAFLLNQVRALCANENIWNALETAHGIARSLPI